MRTFVKAIAADAVLMGSVGRPQMGWPAVRKSAPSAVFCGCARNMGVYANLRPALCFDCLEGCFHLEARDRGGPGHPDCARTDGGVYFGETKETTTLADGQKARRRYRRLYHQPKSSGFCAGRLSRWRGLRGNKVHSAEKFQRLMVHGVKKIVGRKSSPPCTSAITATWNCTISRPTTPPCSCCSNPKQFARAW